MKKRKIWLVSIVLIFILASYLLITGSPILTISLSENPYFPLGNLTTWLGMIALPLTFYFGIKRLREPQTKTERYFTLVLKVFIGLAILWVPISYLLAGNLSNSFSNTPGFQGGQSAMRLFWMNTYITVAAPLLLGIIYGLYSLFMRRNENK